MRREGLELSRLSALVPGTSVSTEFPPPAHVCPWCARRDSHLLPTVDSNHDRRIQSAVSCRLDEWALTGFPACAASDARGAQSRTGESNPDDQFGRLESWPLDEYGMRGGARNRTGSSTLARRDRYLSCHPRFGRPKAIDRPADKTHAHVMDVSKI